MAMTIKDYQERIEKINQKIIKLKAKIKKYELRKNIEAFIKDTLGWYIIDKNIIKSCKTLEQMSDLIYKSYLNRYTEEEVLHYYGTKEDTLKKLQDDYANWIRECDSEIQNALTDIETANNTINTYNNRIEFLKQQNAKPVIQIFKDFFDNWKKEIIEWVNPLYQEYREVSSKSADLHNRAYWYKQTIGQEEWEKQSKEVNHRYYELRNSPVLLRRIENGEQGFNKWLDDYMNDRYNELVDKVTKYTGEITNVTGLHVGMDGTLNGVVEGNNGKARIETIGAGGYNTNQVVNVKHGQIYHYRVLVHELK